MDRIVACPQCGGRLKIAEAGAGTKTQCPLCEAIFSVGGKSAAKISASAPAGEKWPAARQRQAGSVERSAYSGVAPFRFQVHVKNDPAGRLKGALQAEVDAAGLTLRQHKAVVARAPVGTPATYLGNTLFLLSLDGREVTFSVGQLNLYLKRLTHDLAAFLRGERPPPARANYVIPWFLSLAAWAPVLMMGVGLQGGALGGAAVGAFVGSLLAVNLMVVRREQWSLFRRVGFCLGVDAAGCTLFLVAILWLTGQLGALHVFGGKRAVGIAANAVGVDRLIAYWPFDEASGVEAKDASGNGRAGVLTNARRTEGVRGGAVEFSGDGFFDYGASPDFNFAVGEPFTFAGWFRTASSAGPVVSQRNSQSGAPVVDLILENGVLTLVVRSDVDEQAPIQKLRSKSVDDGRWHHFAFVRRAPNVIELYVDGVQQDWRVGAASGGALTTNLRAAGSERYWVDHPGWGAPYWKGALDEFYIFRRSLSGEEIGKLAGK